jgi:hypothetical protein
MVDWHKCRFLESAENLKPLICARVGRTPSTELAREISACLQQGRLFYEAAKNTSLEIRPLEQFYGMSGFAKAIVLSRRLIRLSALPQAHGLRDVSQTGCRLADLTIKIQRRGVFEEFNDVVSPHDRIRYLGNSGRPHVRYVRSAEAARLAGVQFSMREILSRIPGLEQLFLQTFGEAANTEGISLNNIITPGHWSIEVSDPELFTDREAIRRIVVRWRTRFPFLNRWRMHSAQHAWGRSLIKFVATDKEGFDEFDQAHFPAGSSGGFSAILNVPPGSPAPPLPLDRFAPLAGGYTNAAVQYATSPVRENVYLSEFSAHFIALHLLSCLVRYRTSSWSHAISRSATSDYPADDQALALIEKFLELNAEAMPSFVVTVLNPNEDDHLPLENPAEEQAS